MKKFIAGVLVGIMVMTSTLAYAETKQKIDAIFGQVKLVVDGIPVAKETLLYNGTTYVPLRAAAEALGKEVKYDDATKTAYIQQPQVTAALKPTPAPTPKPTNKEIVVTVKQLPVKIDTQYYEAGHTLATIDRPVSISIFSFTNNSEYPIRNCKLSVLERTANKTQDIYCSETVKPGDSANFSTKLTKLDGVFEYEVLKTEYQIVREDGTTDTIRYTKNTDKHEVID